MNIQYINSACDSRRQTLPGSTPVSAFSWLFALILCCLPGVSLYDSELTGTRLAGEKQLVSVSLPAQVHATNTIDSALTGTRQTLASQKRLVNSQPEVFDPPGATLQPWLTTVLPGRYRPAPGQAFAGDSDTLGPAFSATPCSPRAPPVLA